MRSLIGLLLTVFLFAGCQSHRGPIVNQSEVTLENERVLARQLQQALIKEFGETKDKKATDLLNAIALKLVDSSPVQKPKLNAVKFTILNTAEPFIIGSLDQHIFISKGLFSVLEFENELAFLIATQLQLIEEGVPLKHAADLQGEELGENFVTLPTMPPRTGAFIQGRWFEPGGAFDYGVDEQMKASEKAVAQVHASLYDPRGAVTMAQRWKNPALVKQLKLYRKIIPDAEDLLKAVRLEVAKLSPLRNAIVKTAQFEQTRASLSHQKKAKRDN